MKLNETIRKIEAARAAAGKSALTKEEHFRLASAGANLEFCEGVMRHGHPTLEDMNALTDAQNVLRETIAELMAA